MTEPTIPDSHMVDLYELFFNYSPAKRQEQLGGMKNAYLDARAEYGSADPRVVKLLVIIAQCESFVDDLEVS